MQHNKDKMKANKFIINVDDYTLEREIESSVHGSVYLVLNNKTGKECAAKIIKRDVNYENDENYKLNVSREINVMIKCQHPTILKIYGYSLKDIFGNDNVTIFMKYEKNGSLFHYLQRIRGNQEKNYNNTIGQIILVGIARGMMHLHQNQVVHRDLKPGNILLDDQLHPHIIDFGLSKFNINDQLMYQSQIFGTPVYLAPECIESDPYNIKADVYSFGIIMYEIVTKSIPYPSSVTRLFKNRFLYKVAKEDLRPTFTVPIKPSIKELIENCWSKNPDERPTFEEIFKKLAYNSKVDEIDVFGDKDEISTDYQTDDYYMDGVDVEQVIEYANYIDNPQLTKLKNKYESLINIIQNEYDEQQQELYQDIDVPHGRKNEGIFNKIFKMFTNSTRIGQLNIQDKYLNFDYSRNWNNLDANKRNIRGNQSYFYPVGFHGIGLHVDNFDENTVVAYHGTRYGNVVSILRNGFKLPSEIGDVNDYSSLTCMCYIPSEYQNASFVTPSLKYASIYGGNKILENNSNEMIDIVILQVRVRIGSYQILPNPTAVEINDPHFSDDEIEWRVQNPKDIIPYRILIKRMLINEYNQMISNIQINFFNEIYK